LTKKGRGVRIRVYKKDKGRKCLRSPRGVNEKWPCARERKKASKALRVIRRKIEELNLKQLGGGRLGGKMRKKLERTAKEKKG